MEYDDSNWLKGLTGVGYESSSGYESLIGLDVSAMRYVNESVYIRIPFDVEYVAGLAELTLSMKYDEDAEAGQSNAFYRVTVEFSDE